MTAVKVCGIRREDDVEYLNRYLPDYAGFVFAESKRRIKPEQAVYLIKRLDNRIARVGVFVNESIEKVLEICKLCKLDVVQLHGDETTEYIMNLRQILYEQGRIITDKAVNVQNIRIPNIWKAYRVKGNILNDWEQVCMGDAFVLDAYCEEAYGGTGKVFDWNIAAKAGKGAPIVLAGGLNVGNVAKAISVVKPYAVDVSSGVETFGYKDENKIRDFISAVRCCDKGLLSDCGDRL